MIPRLLMTCAVIVPLTGAAASAQQFPPGPGDASCPDDFPTVAVFKIMARDGTPIAATGFSDPNTIIGRSDPFAEGDPPDAGAIICSAGAGLFPDTDLIVADACRQPPSWREGPVTRREVHTEILSMELVSSTFGITIRAGQPYFDSVNPLGVPLPQARFFKNSIGEVASLDAGGTLALDFPARSYFNVFVEVDITGIGKLYNKTPMVLQAIITRFPPDSGLPTTAYIHDPNFAALPLFDEWGLPFGFLLDAGHGSSIVGVGFGGGDARVALTCPASFAVDSLTLGLDPAVTMVTPNHVFDDKGLPVQQTTVYLSSGATPGNLPDMSNARQPPLVGVIGVPPPPSFVAGDTINSVSYGHDGTVAFRFFPPFCPLPAGPGTLYFSVSRTSAGATCTDVWYNSRPALVEQAADIYASAAAPFGRYNGPAGFPAPANDNIMAADNTHLGLRPDLHSGVDQDNVTALELKVFGAVPPVPAPPPDFFYGTLAGPSFVADGDGATIYVYDPASGAFDPTNLVVFAPAAAMGLDLIATGEDVIDALVLSDVNPDDASFPCFPIPNKTLDPNFDEALFSLAPGSPTLAVGGFSAADIFYSDFDGSFRLFATAASLGLLAGDDVDAIDIKPIEQCDFIEGEACAGGGVSAGACSVAGVCAELESEDTCAVIGGNFQGPGSSCTSVFDPGDIPTVSQWGLVVIALLVLAAGTVVLRRRVSSRRIA